MSKEKKESEGKKKVEEEAWQVTEVPTQTTLGIVDTDNDQVYSPEQCLVVVLNNQKRIEKKLNSVIRTLEG